MKRISLYPNPRRDRGLSCTAFVAERLSSLGATIRISKEYEKTLSHLKEKGVLFCEEEKLFLESDLMITLGGDGTILSIARQAAEADLPIFGINLGHVGFLTSLEKKELHRIDRILDTPLSTSSRMLLSCEVNGQEKLLALNEVVLAPDRGFHIVEMSLYTGRKKLCDFRSDGLIFNTPTGSTGYAFSAGGAVIDHGFDCIGVKAISSYLLINAHHMIFPPETRLFVKNFRHAGGSITLCADGRETVTVKAEDTVCIKRSERAVKLVSLKPRSNLEVFFRKF